MRSYKAARGAVLVALISGLLLPVAGEAGAETPTVFVVNTTDDTNDETCDETHCSLREALTRSGLVRGLDGSLITFELSSGAVIAPQTQLPDMGDRVVLDGSIPGGRVTLDGSGLPDTAAGVLVMGANRSLIHHVEIEGFEFGPGVRIEGQRNRIENSHIGAAYGSPSTILQGIMIDSYGNVVRDTVINAVEYGIWLNGPGNRVLSNNIGVDGSGRRMFGLVDQGIRVTDWSNTIRGNVIGGAGEGISIEGYANRITGNWIGVGRDGEPFEGVDGTGTPANFVGVSLSDNSWSTTVGTQENPNEIAWNQSYGVEVDANSESGSTDNAILSLFHDNGTQGIALGQDGPNANDDDDLDEGPNHLQNHPELLSTSTASGITTIQGSLESEPTTQFELDFFHSPECHPSGAGEGASHLGRHLVTTGESGRVDFSVEVSAVGPGVLTATATMLTAFFPKGEVSVAEHTVFRNTSEFSPCLDAGSDAPPPGEPDFVSQFAQPGETVTTDSSGDGATPEDNTETYVTHPDGGLITISEDDPTQELEGGAYVTLGEQIDISAPPATPSDPIVIGFRYDHSIVKDYSLEQIEIFRNGVLVEDCLRPTSVVADPDPCVTDREELDDGDYLFTVLTSAASQWNAGLRAPRQIGGGGGPGLPSASPSRPSPSPSETAEPGATASPSPSSSGSPTSSSSPSSSSGGPVGPDTDPPLAEGGADTDAISPNGDGNLDDVTVGVAFSERVLWRFTIVPAGNSRQSQALIFSKTGDGGKAEITWPEPGSGTTVAEGSYRWELTGTDRSGNQMTPLVGLVAVDVSPPQITRLRVSSDEIVLGDRVKIIVSVDEGGRAKVKVKRKGMRVARPRGEVLDDAGTVSFTWDPKEKGGRRPGRYKVKAIVVDEAGNRSTRTTAIRVRGRG